MLGRVLSVRASVAVAGVRARSPDFLCNQICQEPTRRARVIKWRVLNAIYWVFR
jgi:hypothetical protein